MLKGGKNLGLISWLRDKLGTAVPISGESVQEFTDEYISIIGDIYIRELCFWSGVNIIANAVSKCEFKTFFNKKEVKGPEYYLWNVEPNKNQNSSGFIHKWIAKLYRNNECLVIEQNGKLLIADSFTRTPYALYDDKFEQVTVGDFTFNRPFFQSEVLYFQLSEKNMHQVTTGLYEAYSKLIAYSMKSFQRSRGLKGKFKYDALPAKGSPQEQVFNDLINTKFKAFLSADSAVIPLGSGHEFTELTQRTYANETSRDIRAMIDDVSDFTAKGFGIPPALMRGDVQDTSKAVDQLLTFCVDPLVDMLAEEINRKRNGYAGFAAGNYTVIDTKTIKHIDLLSVATAIDKLIGSGSFCINDIRKACGESEIDEPWAKQHFITKNYSTVADLLAALEGGTVDGK
jgi:HK97 family phage portal protein